MHPNTINEEKRGVWDSSPTVSKPLSLAIPVLVQWPINDIVQVAENFPGRCRPEIGLITWVPFHQIWFNSSYCQLFRLSAKEIHTTPHIVPPLEEKGQPLGRMLMTLDILYPRTGNDTRTGIDMVSIHASLSCPQCLSTISGHTEFLPHWHGIPHNCFRTK